MHKHPELLLEVLEMAVEDQPFYLYVDRLSIQQSPHSFYQNCGLAIKNHIRHMQRNSFTYPSVSRPTMATTNPRPHDFENSASDSLDTVQKIRAALFAKAGCRYGVNIRMDRDHIKRNRDSISQFSVTIWTLPSIIRRVYNKLKDKTPQQNKHFRLSLSVHAVGNTAGSEGLTPSQLVFGATPRIQLPSCESLPQGEQDRFNAMLLAWEKMETITAQRRVSAALKHRHFLRTYPVFKFGDKVRIWREDHNKFVGPFTVHGYDDEKTIYVTTDKIRPFSVSKALLISPEEVIEEQTKGSDKKKLSSNNQWNFSSSSMDLWRTRRTRWNRHILASIRCSIYQYLCSFYRIFCFGNSIRTIRAKNSSASYLTVSLKD